MKEVEIAQQLARKVVDLYNEKDPKYEHIAPKEMDKVVAAIKESEAWLENCRQKFTQNYQPHMPVPVKAREIFEQRRALENKINPIINSPKPKVEPPKDDSKKKEDPKAKKPAEGTNANHTESNSGDPQSMDVE